MTAVILTTEIVNFQSWVVQKILMLFVTFRCFIKLCHISLQKRTSYSTTYNWL